MLVTAAIAGPDLERGPSLRPSASAETCGTPGGFDQGGRIESPDVVLFFRTLPAAIEIGRHFSLEAIVCTRTPGAVVTGLRVDAQMPEHRHGMNYRPRVWRDETGRYTAEGFLFHMPGRWQLLFDVDRAGRTDHLVADVVLE